MRDAPPDEYFVDVPLGPCDPIAPDRWDKYMTWQVEDNLWLAGLASA